MTRSLFWIAGEEGDFVDDAQWFAWQDATQALIPVDPNGIRVKHELAPMLANIAAFLQRGDPIKPSLAKIVGRLLAGEKFCSLPPPLLLPEQFNDDGVVVWDATGATNATIKAFTFRLVNGKLLRAEKRQAA